MDSLYDFGLPDLPDKFDNLIGKKDDLLNKQKEAKEKLSSLGVNLFSPKDTLDLLKGNIQDELKERLDLHKKLDEIRNKIEKEKSKAEQKLLKEVSSDISSRAQDGSCTAVVDGMLDALTPDSIKNPAGGESEEGGEDDYEMTEEEKWLYGLDDETQTMMAQYEDPFYGIEDEIQGSEEKKEFFGAAADLFGQVMGKTKNAASSAFNTAKEAGGDIFSAAKDMALSGTGVKADASFVSNAISFVTGNVSKAAGFARDTIASSASNYLNSTPEERQSMDGMLAAIKKDATNTLIDRTIENSVSILGAGISANNKNIANVSDAVNNVSNQIVDNAAKISGTSDKNTSTESVQAAVAANTIRWCGRRGNCGNVRKLAERNDVPYENSKEALESAIKNSNQSYDDIVDLLKIAERLGIDLNDIDCYGLKSPEELSNIIKSRLKTSQTEQDKAFIDLLAFRNMTNNSTNLANVILGTDQTKYYQAISANNKPNSRSVFSDLPEIPL